MEFWKDKSFWIRECAIGAILMALSVIVFIKTNDLEGAILLFIEIFAFIQPFLLIAYFVDKKFGGRKR